MVATDFSRWKKLDVEPKAIKQIEFVMKLKSEDGINADGIKSCLFQWF